MERPNVLVVCGRNKKRSRTAEYIFKNDSRFNIKTAGVSAKSEIQINEKLVNWANIIIAMENGQKNRIANQYRSLKLPKIEVIDIPDDYEYLDEELIEILTDKINGTLKLVYKL
jgi:predicted protein tyrosine phosphatase